MPPDHRATFRGLVQTACGDGTLVKLTLGKPRPDAGDLRNVYVKPVTLKRGPEFSFVFRHATRDVTKNHPADAAVAEVTRLLNESFFDAHLFTTNQQAQLESQPDGAARLRTKSVAATAPAAMHDQAKQYLIPADAPWLRALGVTNDRRHPRDGMVGKFRQIQKFAELIAQIVIEADAPTDRPWRIADMGCGKGYLTFALAAQFGDAAEVTGIERRADLVDLCNRTARACGFTHLRFAVGDIGSTTLEPPDLLVALHACDTATDDALAQGIAANARALVVSPCCQKELRPQLTAPTVLADALRPGIFQERQAEFVTDSLRALLLEWAGYRTKVFEFISTEHTARNLMITAVRPPTSAAGASTAAALTARDALATRIRAFATFYGIHTHALARHLHFPLLPTSPDAPATK